MLIVFDIGNTNIVVGCFDGNELMAQFRLATNAVRTNDEYFAILDSLLQREFGAKYSFKACIISSVVPPLTPQIVRLVKDAFALDAILVGPGIKTGVQIKISEPTTVGADRVVNSVAVKELYGTPALVVDFGTATSFDYVSKEGNYEGGIIAPGVLSALDGLVRNTAKLPRIELEWPKSLIGKGTVHAMQVGSVVGYVCMVDGLIERIIAEVGTINHIVATGGLGELFTKHSSKIKHYDAHLTLKGLRILADINSHDRK